MPFLRPLLSLLVVSAGLDLRAQEEVPIGELPAGKGVILTQEVVVETGPQVTSQGVVSGVGGLEVLTDDPDLPGDSDSAVIAVPVGAIVNEVVRALAEDEAFTFEADFFDQAFSMDEAGVLPQIIRITSLPAHGTLLFLGVGVVTEVPLEVPRGQLVGLRFVPEVHYFGADAGFSFTAAGPNGGVFAAESAFFRFDVNEVNDGPTGVGDVVERVAEEAVLIPIKSLLFNDADREGDLPLSLVDVSYSGRNGASVEIQGDFVLFDPQGHAGRDSFTYTVRDARGGVTSRVPVKVLILVGEREDDVSSVVRGENGTATFRAAGLAHRVYRMQSYDAEDEIWEDLPDGLVQADAEGRIEFVDRGPLPATRIYRAVHP